MNLSSVIGVGIAVAVLWFGVIHGAKNPLMFLDGHALMLVVGGTLAASLIAFPLRQLINLADFLFLGVLLKKKLELADVVNELRAVAGAYRNKDFKNINAMTYQHAFVGEGVALLLDPSMGIEEIQSVMLHRRDRFKWRYQQDAKTLNAIAKYPPAFGLLGATTGMIAMMTNLGGAGGTAAIGEAMAVALVATFWGIAAANFVLLPLADHAQRNFQRDQHLRTVITEGILMIKEGVPENILLENLRSMLDFEDRTRVPSHRAGRSFFTSSKPESLEVTLPGYTADRSKDKKTG